MKLNAAVSKVYEMSLYDGESDGLIQINLGEDVMCYKISKDFFSKYQDDEDIKNKKSIYVLYGSGKFYVGQAGIRKDDTAITSRIKEHLKDPQKDFVEEIVFFCHSTNKWSGGELDYLEASLINYFKEHGFPLYKDQNNETIDPYLDSGVKFKYEKHLREIIIMIDILGYDAIRKVLTSKNVIDSKKTKNTEKNKQSSLTVKKQLPVEIYNKLMTMRKGKGDVCKQLLIDWGISVEVNNLNFASFSNKNKQYWMEPSRDVLTEDWMFVLFDDNKKEMDLFFIPAKTFTYKDGQNNSLRLRKDKPGLLKLEIKQSPYIDKQSDKDFSSFHVQKICFEIV